MKKLRDNHRRIIRLAAGTILLAGAVYVWSGIGLHPETVESILSGRPQGGFWQIIGRFFIAGIISAAVGLSLAAIAGAIPSRQNLRKGIIPGIIVVLALTSYPPMLLVDFAGGGFAVALLLMLQNAMGVLGIALISWTIGEFAGERIKLPPRLIKYDAKISPAILAVLYAGIIYTISYYVFGAIPHIGDGVIQLFQAKIFAAGHFTAPAPELIEFFFNPFMVVKDGQWFGQYPPGYSLLLTPGVIAGLPAVVNPLLTGLTLMVFILVLREIGLSRWWGFLFALSPLVIFMGGTFMSHVPSMFWGGLGLLFFLKSKRKSPEFLFLWGLCAGLMFSTRPYTALCFNLPLLLIILRHRIGLGILAAGAGLLIGCAPLFIHNHFTTGSIFTFGYGAAWDDRSGLFFGESPWGPEHTPQMGLVHLGVLLYGLNTYLFAVPLPALLGVVLWILYRRDKNWKEWALFWAGITGVAGYFCYFYVDLVYGPRFAYASAFLLLAITALGLKALYRRLRDSGMTVGKARWSFIAGGTILLGLWLTISLPFRVRQYSDRYYNVENDFMANIERYDIHNALIFLDDFPSTDRHARLYSIGFSNRQARYYTLRLSDRAVKSALINLGVEPEEGYGRTVDLNLMGAELNRYWNNPESIPEPGEDEALPYIPLTQGLLYMFPFIEDNDIIFARDLGAHDLALTKVFPGREHYRLMWQEGQWVLRKLVTE